MKVSVEKGPYFKIDDDYELPDYMIEDDDPSEVPTVVTTVTRDQPYNAENGSEILGQVIFAHHERLCHSCLLTL